MKKVLYYHKSPISKFTFEKFDIIDRPPQNFRGYELSKLCEIKSPCFRLCFDNYFDMNFEPVPEIPTNFTSTFEELVNRRAIELWDIGKPIRLWWSGGIDSTCALVGLLQTRRLDTSLTVYLSTNSVQENPDFYDILVKKKVKLQWHSDEDYMFNNVENWNGDTINVNGCGGDELFTSITEQQTAIKTFFEIKDDHWINIIKDSDILNIVNEYVELSPYKPETCWELLWWLSRSIDDLSSRYLSPRFLKDPSVYHLEHAFFYTKYFELWSLANPYAGHNGTWNTYKWPMKKFIYNFDKNREYLDYKEKKSSLPFVLKSRNREDKVINKIVYEDGTYVRYVRN